MGAWTQSANNEYIPAMNYIVFGLLIVSIGSDSLAITSQVRKIKQVRKNLQTTDDDLLHTIEIKEKMLKTAGPFIIFFSIFVALKYGILINSTDTFLKQRAYCAFNILELVWLGGILFAFRPRKNLPKNFKKSVSVELFKNILEEESIYKDTFLISN